MALSPLAIAYTMAHEYHDGQMYGDKPYAWHLDQVATSLPQDTKNYKHHCVAYLHDILEDTACTEVELRKHFSEDIVDAVIAMTKVKGEAYFDYILKVRMNPIALVVKRADTLCNLTESVKMGMWKRVAKYSEQMILLCE